MIQKPVPPSPDREDRVAAALRENLRKRKQQQQARANSGNTKTQQDDN